MGDEFWNDLILKQKDDDLFVVWVESSSKRFKKGKNFLMKKIKSNKDKGGDFRIEIITQRCLASAITAASPLKDPSNQTALLMGDVGQTHGAEKDFEQKAEKVSELGNGRKEPLVAESVPSSLGADVLQGDGDSINVKVDVQAKVCKNNLEVTESGEALKVERVGNRGWISSQQQPSKHSGNNTQGSSQPHGWISSIPAQASQTGRRDDSGEDNNNNKELEDCEVKNMLLRGTKDGWLCAAPQGTERTRQKRTQIEMNSH